MKIIQSSLGKDEVFDSVQSAVGDAPGEKNTYYFVKETVEEIWEMLDG